MNGPVRDRSQSPTPGEGTTESAVSCLTIRRQYSSQIVTQTLSVKLDHHRANQSKLVSQLRLIHHLSPSQCICLPFSYSVEHSQLCVTVCLSVSHARSHAALPILFRPTPTPPPLNSQKLCWGWLNPNETQNLFVYVATTQERSVLPDPQTFSLLAV